MMRLYDTQKQCYRDFLPEPEVSIYVCGITPYDSAHLGHIFTFMTYDLLQRRLEDLGHRVKMVRNITDVDEPIYVKARQLRMDYRELAQAEVASFQAVLATLNFRPMFAEPRASEYINEMADAVSELLEMGVAYYVEQDVYFDTSKARQYGGFAGFNERLLFALVRERGGNPELSGKRHPLDFLLWMQVTDQTDPARWETNLGWGRPGWHIECTIMSAQLLGTSFDIHGGGTDLIFPHHESEIAQGMALNHTMPARFWLHVSPLLMAGEKMSKSLGNMVFAKDLLGTHSAAAIRLALMHYHHRVGGEWQPELLETAEMLMTHVHEAAMRATDLQATALLDAVRKALDTDLDTPAVIVALQAFIHASCALPKQAIANPIVRQALELSGLA
jgi:L-cysteine:1D-myo-inositol 2-amino-2-deoxy-alpha-D-glucopyranoside ligase